MLFNVSNDQSTLSAACHISYPYRIGAKTGISLAPYSSNVKKDLCGKTLPRTRSFVEPIDCPLQTVT